MSDYQHDPELTEDPEIVPLMIGPVGKVPVKYVLDYTKEGQTKEEREEYVNLLAMLGTNICASALDYGDPYVVSTIPELNVVDTDSGEPDPYEYVKPKLVTINQKVAYTVFYHKNLPASIMEELSGNLLKHHDNLSIKDFDVITNMVCLDDSVMTEFAYHTDVAKFQIDCFHVDDIILYLKDSDNPKDKRTLCIRILYIPDQTGKDKEFDSTASFVVSLDGSTKKYLQDELGKLKLELTTEALTYVNTTKGVINKPNVNCFDVIQFRKLARASLNALSQAVNKNVVQ